MAILVLSRDVTGAVVVEDVTGAVFRCYFTGVVVGGDVTEEIVRGGVTEAVIRTKKMLIEMSLEQLLEVMSLKQCVLLQFSFCAGPFLECKLYRRLALVPSGSRRAPIEKFNKSNVRWHLFKVAGFFKSKY